MEHIQNFAYGSLSTLGILQVVNPVQQGAVSMDDPEILIKSLISLIAGVLSSLLLRLIKEKKEKRRNKQFKKD